MLHFCDRATRLSTSPFQQMEYISLLFFHWLGDYLLQTNRMAKLKSERIEWLTFHALAYSFALTLGALLLLPWKIAIGFIALNAALHWITDFITSRASAYFKNNPRIFFPIIGFDQFLHAAALILTYDHFSQL